MFVCIYQDFRGKLLRARFVRSSSSIQELNSIRCICLSLNSTVTIETGTLNGELNVRQALCAISVRPSLSYNPSLWISHSLSLTRSHMRMSHVFSFLGEWVSMAYDRWTVYGIKPFADPIERRSSTLLHDLLYCRPFCASSVLWRRKLVILPRRRGSISKHATIVAANACINIYQLASTLLWIL